MEFNKVVRGAKRAVYDEKTVFDILDAGFVCHVGFVHAGSAMVIPTAYGRDGDVLYLHGSAKKFMLNQILDGQMICISVMHLDGLVLARSLFDTGVNYRSVMLHGSASLVQDETERMHSLKVFTEQTIAGRWAEVAVGTEAQLNATMVVKFCIERASCKVRTGGPTGDELLQSDYWSGTLPMAMRAGEPIPDVKFDREHDLSSSVINFVNRYNT
jgi:uncharacterized protein